MIKIGLTGGIGAGKSYVAELFVKLGFPVFDSDNEAKKCMVNDVVLIKEIKNLFGDEIYQNNVLQKRLLADIIFSDNKSLDQLNRLVHPIVKQSFLKWCACQDSNIVLKEAAILFESNSDDGLHQVICVTAPKKLRIERVKLRDNINEIQVLDRMKNQMNQAKKESLSDFVILNDGKKLLLPQVLKIVSQLN